MQRMLLCVGLVISMLLLSGTASASASTDVVGFQVQIQRGEPAPITGFVVTSEYLASLQERIAAWRGAAEALELERAALREAVAAGELERELIEARIQDLEASLRSARFRGRLLGGAVLAVLVAIAVRGLTH